MAFIHDDFLLQSDVARRLYHDVAEALPIIDYHCHLPPQLVAENHRFRDLAEIWLAGDHYKWRAMRANGVPEDLCTGDADPYDKFLAWARTVPYTLRNPLYHWTHLELKRYFDIDVALNEDTAPEVWTEANRRLAEPDRSAHGILATFGVEIMCTTDDPADGLEMHRRIRHNGLTTRVYPAFRLDPLFRIDQPESFPAYAERLGEQADTDVSTFEGLLTAIEKRHQAFHEQGCRLSDHGLTYALDAFCHERVAAAIYTKARNGRAVSPLEKDQFGTFLMLFTGRLDAGRGWTKQLHLGAMRNVNSRRNRVAGPDTGYDSIGDWPQAERLARYLDRLDQDGGLPKMIFYNLNPADNYLVATMAGNFQDGTVPGKIQFGSGWWFLDQIDGMTWQINALANNGLLSRFVGMVTDSRSFMSYPRHEYFRRLLCNILGEDVERGLLPDDFDLLARMVRDICHDNAARYFGFEEVV